MKIWEEDINAKGGLLGRPVKLIYYDDQSNPSTRCPASTPSCSTSTRSISSSAAMRRRRSRAAMPVVIQKKKLFISLFGTGVNEKFNYPKYFSMIPNGPTPKPAFTRGFFKVAEAQKPKPQTIAIAAADAEFGRNACEGARGKRQGVGLQDRLRQELSAIDHRLLADRAGDPGRQSGSAGDLLLSARHRRHGQGDERSRLQAEDVGRRDGRPAGDRVQDPAWPAAQRRGQFRDLAAGQVDAVPRLDGAAQEVSGARQGRGRRPARLLHAGLGLCLSAGARRRHRRHQEPQ